MRSPQHMLGRSNAPRTVSTCVPESLRGHVLLEPSSLPRETHHHERDRHSEQGLVASPACFALAVF